MFPVQFADRFLALGPGQAAKASIELRAQPGAAIHAPSGGQVLHFGKLSSFEFGWVIRHPNGVISLVSMGGNWVDEPATGASRAVDASDVLGTLRGALPRAATYVVTWEAYFLKDPALDAAASLADVVGARSPNGTRLNAADDAIDWIRQAGAEINTKALLGFGILQLAEAERGLLGDLGFALEGSELPLRRSSPNQPPRDPSEVPFLVPAGYARLAVTSGVIFRTTATSDVLIKPGVITRPLVSKIANDVKISGLSFDTGDGLLAGSAPGGASFAGAVPAIDWSAMEKQAEAQRAGRMAAAPVVNADQERAEQERVAREQAEQQRVAREQADRERVAREQAERDRQERERLASEAAQRDRAERARAEQERQAAVQRERELADARRTQEVERLQREAREREAELARLRQQVAQAEAQRSAPPALNLTAEQRARRKALVIGNDAYTHVPRLDNAGADAKSMADALRGVGFQVTVEMNLTERGFKEALRNFRSRVQGGDEVVVFFAGHGVQIGNSNYLLPTDMRGMSEEQVKDDAIQLQKILDDMQERRPGFFLAIVDACRDNPFKVAGRSIGTRGLAPTSAASGQMIIFSAGAGQQALDRLGNDDKEANGLFTRLFVREISKPGVPVDRMLRSVRSEVARLAKTIGHEQTPALYDQSLGDFFFRP